MTVPNQILLNRIWKGDNTKDCSTTTDNQEKEDKDNGKDKSNDALILNNVII